MGPGPSRRSRQRGPGLRGPGRVSVVLVLCACVAEVPAVDADRLSPFEPGIEGVARVSANVTACIVDAMCTLTLEFADTAVTAVYGSGERPAPACTIDVAVSNVAFDLVASDVVHVVLEPCEGSGLVVASLTLGDAS